MPVSEHLTVTDFPAQSSRKSNTNPRLRLGFKCTVVRRWYLAADLHASSHLSNMAEVTSTVLVRPDDAQSFVVAMLEASGVSAKNAGIIAQGLVQADLRGVESHGINRIPSYLARVRGGVLDPKAEPTLSQVTPVVAQVDGHNGFGFLAAHFAMDTAISMAQTFGIGMVSVKHSNHFGMSAWIVRQAVEAGMCSLVFTNSSPALPVFGGKSKLLGVSPIACGAPGGNNSKPFILDMAPSIAARGKIYKALRRGEKIPSDWALDGEGNPTDDPQEALKGVMLPMGGPKGSALAIMMDVFSGVLSGSAFAGGVTGPYDMSKPGDVGHFIIAIKPDLFVSLDECRERMDVLYRRVVESDKMPGVERIYFPGEIEQLTEEKRLKEGIPFVQDEINALNAEAEKLGVASIRIASN
ncbi:Malate/L-lactate dehydrogenase [Podospora didyma]|uniref:Malate/L-lactate dehydrogenase n=1 Tax=Podospora didyma TaxID=330526 RepID=A0AAE0NI54_9PEZI|nr:Malate/L-lactate dehydrogenase [Podospora didyma]